MKEGDGDRLGMDGISRKDGEGGWNGRGCVNNPACISS